MANKDNQKNSAVASREERKARLAKEATVSKQKKEANRGAIKIAKRVVAIVLAIAIACGIAWVVIDQTAVLKKTNTVLSFGEIDISELEYSYYYNRQISNVYYMAQMYAQYGMNIGIDPTVAPDKQNYGTDKDGKPITLAKYAQDATVEALQEYMILYNEAIEKGYKLTEEEQKKIDESVEQLRQSAAQNNFSLNAYLKATMGKGITEKFYREQLEIETIVSRYQQETNKKLMDSYSAKEIENTYNKNKDNYDSIDARIYNFTVTPLKAEKGESDKDLAKRQEKANKQLKADAEKMANAAVSDKAFVDYAKKLNKDNKDYNADDATLMKNVDNATITSSVSEAGAKWAFDDKRQAGDVKVFQIGDDKNVSGYTVLFIKKAQYAPEAVDVRHILVSFVDDPSAQQTEPTKEQKEAAKKNADAIFAEWKNGPKTEESFAELAKKKSKDEGSAKEGGLIAGITSDANLVEPFLNWSIDSKRKPGDTGIVETQYGYHIMYFSKKDLAWKNEIRAGKASEDFQKEMDDLKKSDKYKLQKNDKKITKVVDSFVKEYSKQLAMQAAQK